jgi:hypothetical protein
VTLVLERIASWSTGGWDEPATPGAYLGPASAEPGSTSGAGGTPGS